MIIVTKISGGFNEEEVASLFSVIPSLKHKTILMLIYSGELRKVSACAEKIFILTGKVFSLRAGKIKRIARPLWL